MKRSKRFIAKNLNVSIDAVREALSELGYAEEEGDSYSGSGWGTPTYSKETQRRIAFKTNSSSISWYCDNCNAYLNYQPGFNTKQGSWVCQKCGYTNSITEDDITWE